MFGRESKANLGEIVGYTISQAQEAIDRGYRNKVVGTMYRSVPRHSRSQLRADRPGQARGHMERQEGEVEYQMQTRMTDPLEQQRTIFFKDGDTVHKMTFNDKNPSAMRFVTAAKNLGVEEMPVFFRAMSVFTKLWTKSNTQWNVNFVLANAVKDVQTGLVNASTLDQKGLRRRMVKNLASAGCLTRGHARRVQRGGCR